MDTWNEILFTSESFFFFISLFVTMNLYIYILYFYTHHFAIYISFRVCFFQILILRFTSKHQLTFIFFAWITVSSEKQYSQTLTKSFLLSQYLFVTWQAPVSSHLILTLQVAKYRNHSCMRKLPTPFSRPEGVCLWKLPLYSIKPLKNLPKMCFEASQAVV